MLRLARYARVSTGEQTSVDAQLDTLITLAAQLGGSIVATETDVQTGFDSDRPGYQRILAMARRHEIDGVLVYRLDRFGRDHAESIRAVNELTKLSVEVHSASEPSIGDPFVRDLLLLLANREVRVLSDRVKMMHKAKAREGQWQSRPPTGYRIQTTGEGSAATKRLSPDPLKAPLVTQLFEAAAAPDATGHLPTVRELRDLAHAIGLTSGTGRELTRGHVHKLLTNPAYMGDVVYGRQANGKFEGKRNRPESEWTVVPDAHPALIDRETFARVQASFAQHLRIQGDARRSAWFLTSLIFCGHCGSRMFGANAGRSKNGSENYAYACQRYQSYGQCEMKQAGGKMLDALVKAEISQFRVTDDVRRAALVMLREQESAREQDANAQRSNLMRSRQRIERERRDLAQSYMDRGRGVVPHEVYAQLEAEKAQALEIIDRTLANLREVKALDISAELAALEMARWEEVEQDDPLWRGAAVLLIDRITVTKGEKRGEPVVSIAWTPAAQLIRTAVAQAVL